MDALATLQAEHRRLKAAFPFDGIGFEGAALAVFRFQAQANPVYGRWLQLLKVDWWAVSTLEEIPFLPIEVYKKHLVTSTPWADASRFFYSSRTTGQVPSKNPVYGLETYHAAALLGFEAVFGPVSKYQFLSLLPSYNQTGESSLVYMVHYLAQQAGQKEAVTVEATPESLQNKLDECRQASKIPLVFGVTHALVTVAELGSVADSFILIETGGMKGRGTELTRAALHGVLADAFPGADIRSEYGMTELFSQGYTLQHRSEAFCLPPWMGYMLRDPTDPLSAPQNRKRGVLSIIDLANFDTCAFIATSDLAEIRPDGLAILGRLDHAEIRGCNLLTL